jgi:hypothetical protein
MGYTDKIKQREYMKTLMAKRRANISVIPVILEISNSPHHLIHWTTQIVRVHREFYKFAWFARWKYVVLLVHKELLSIFLSSIIKCHTKTENNDYNMENLI